MIVSIIIQNNIAINIHVRYKCSNFKTVKYKAKLNGQIIVTFHADRINLVLGVMA